MDKEIPATFSTPEEEMAYWKAHMLAISEKQAAERVKKSETLTAMVDKKLSLRPYYWYKHTISIYRSVAIYLRDRGGWREEEDKECIGGLDLLIGGWCGKGFDFKVLGGVRSRNGDGGSKMLVNFCRGWRTICDKAQQTITLRDYCLDEGYDISKIMPFAIVYNSEHPNEKELSDLRDRFNIESQNSDKKNIWIVKPSAGGCGDDMYIFINH